MFSTKQDSRQFSLMLGDIKICISAFRNKKYGDNSIIASVIAKLFHEVVKFIVSNQIFGDIDW